MLFACFEARAQVRTIKDRDGNSYPVKIMPDNKEWMTVNLNLHIPGAYCYENSGQQCREYGRLYTWKVAQEACRLLGEGWRLPSNEEWQQLGKSYGGVRDRFGRRRQSSLPGADTRRHIGIQHCLRLGGRDATGSYARGGAHGFYWTATESDSAHAWLYNFGKNGKIMNRHHDGEKEQALSVRCIRDR